MSLNIIGGANGTPQAEESLTLLPQDVFGVIVYDMVLHSLNAGVVTLEQTLQLKDAAKPLREAMDMLVKSKTALVARAQADAKRASSGLRTATLDELNRFKT